MPEVLRNNQGDLDWAKVFMAFAASAVLILQQYQAYKVAEISEETKRDRVRILKERDIDGKILQLEEVTKAVKKVLRKQESICRRLEKIERNLK